VYGVYGWDVRQVSADDNPRSEKSRLLNVWNKLIYLNKTSKKKLQSNDNSVWCELYNMYWNHFNTVWNTQRIVWNFPEYSLNMMCMWCSKNPLLWFWNNMIIVCLSWQNGFNRPFNIVCTNYTSSIIKLYSSLISNKPYCRVWNVQTILRSFETVDILFMMIKL